MFGAADGFFGEERGVHGLASESGFGRGDGEVASIERRSGVEGGVLVELGASLEDSGRRK